ncbi:MAG: hypothetical protein Q8N37_02555 [bacterium]|nr:hypothetical protein [bacterium]
MFKKQEFTDRQIENYFNSALKDFKIARDSDIPEIIFKFSYDSLLKIAIAVCAKNNLRVRSRVGHHIDLVKKLSEYLGDEDIFAMGNEMRKKRNFDLYSGGVLITRKESLSYKEWLKKIVLQVEEYLNAGQKLF